MARFVCVEMEQEDGEEEVKGEAGHSQLGDGDSCAIAIAATMMTTPSLLLYVDVVHHAANCHWAGARAVHINYHLHSQEPLFPVSFSKKNSALSLIPMPSQTPC